MDPEPVLVGVNCYGLVALVRVAAKNAYGDLASISGKEFFHESFIGYLRAAKIEGPSSSVNSGWRVE